MADQTQWTPPTGPRERQRGTGGRDLRSRQPGRPLLITTPAVDGPERVGEVVQRLRANQAEWEALGNKGRSPLARQLRDWLIDNQDADRRRRCRRRPARSAADAGSEAAYLTDLINFYGKKAKKFIGEEKVRGPLAADETKKLRIQYRPYPVVGVISPWNFPLILSLGDGSRPSRPAPRS